MLPNTEVGTAPLFEPLITPRLTLANRIVMAPMTRELSPGGVPGPDVARYYEQRAAGGVGLIITEGTVIDHPASSSSPRVPRFHGADALAGWAEVVRRVHRHGARIVPQLWHVGLDPLLWGRTATVGRAMPNGVNAVSPSGVDPADGRPTSGLSPNGIEEIISGFARAAATARELGFDGIELHAAHGYLIDQFFWAVTNQRQDRYGGDLNSRSRFAAEVIEACRAATDPNFPIILRYSQWKVGHYKARLAASPRELEQFLKPLVAAGVDIFHCSTRRFWQSEFEGSPLNLAGWTKHITGLPTITVGSVGLRGGDFLGYLKGEGAEVGDVDALCQRLASGEFDLVAVGRALIANPNWPSTIRDGRFRALRAFEAAMLESLD